jgi:hypothetical protein
MQLAVDYVLANWSVFGLLRIWYSNPISRKLMSIYGSKIPSLPAFHCNLLTKYSRGSQGIHRIHSTLLSIVSSILSQVGLRVCHIQSRNIARSICVMYVILSLTNSTLWCSCVRNKIRSLIGYHSHFHEEMQDVPFNPLKSSGYYMCTTCFDILKL